MDVERSFVDDMGEDVSRAREQHFSNSAVRLAEPAGSMFLVNTLALHRGVVPTHTDRLLIWARYGLGPNTNSADLERGPLGIGWSRPISRARPVTATSIAFSYSSTESRRTEVRKPID